MLLGIQGPATGMGRVAPVAPAPPASSDPKIREAYAYWRRIHSPQGLPGRQHFEPTDIPRLLRHTRLLDVIGQPSRFKVRVIGTLFTERLGYDTTGRFLDEVFEGFEASPFHQRLVDVVENKQPIWCRGPLRWYCRESFSTVERIHLPLARDGEAVDMVMTVTNYKT